MKPHWIEKTDPTVYPARAIAAQWQKLMASNYRVNIRFLSHKEYGQFRDLHRFLGDWTQFVVEWMTVPSHWRHFTESVRQEARLLIIPLVPHLGFLLEQRTRALRIMREYLRDSESPEDIRFVREQDLLFCKRALEAKALLCGAKMEVIHKITTASTPAEIQAVFNEIQGEN